MSNSSLLEFLANPANYPHRPDNVRLSETHISWVFLAGEQVFKVKKPVKFDFLDFSTVERRKRDCEREVRLNRRLAGDVYEAVLPLYERDGQWSFSDDDQPAEFCVRMRRLPEEHMLDVRAAQGQLAEADLAELADLLAGFYRSAKTSDRVLRDGSAAAIESNVRASLKTLRTLLPNLELLDGIESAQLGFLVTNASLFEERARKGKICDGHGDLRAQHVCMTHPPVIFDCVEFNDRLRHLDRLDDVAFLLMDLDMLGCQKTAQQLWAMLAERLGESIDEPLLDFFRSYRACIRGKVEAIREQQLPVQSPNHARAHRRSLEYVEKAAEYLCTRHTPRLFVMVGVMGSGKSTVGEALADAIGARRLSSDSVRKALFGSAGRNAAFRKGVYAPDQTDRVYAAMMEQAQALLLRGVSVILDATFQTRMQRAAALDLAKKTGVRPLFVECRIAPGEAIARLDRRIRSRRSESDGRPELLEEQTKCFEATTELAAGSVLPVNTSQKVPAIIDAIRSKLSESRKA